MRAEDIDRFLYNLPWFLCWVVIWLVLVGGIVAGCTWLLLKIGG